MKTFTCKCGTTFQASNLARNVKWCPDCKLEAKRAAKNKWVEANKGRIKCECGQGYKVTRASGCAACNAAFETAHSTIKPRRFVDELRGWTVWAEQWRRNYYLAKRQLSKLQAA